MKTAEDNESFVSDRQGKRPAPSALKIINAVVKIVAITLLVLIVMGASQLAQAMLSSNDIRDSAIEEWVLKNPERAYLAEEYVDTCIKARIIETNAHDMSKPIMVRSECGKSIGASDLESYIQSKLSALKTLAWPLSLIDK